MDVSLELGTRYHERKKKKKNHQENKSEDSKSSSSHHKNYSSSSHKKKNFRVQKREKPHSSLLNKDHKIMGSEKERQIKEVLCLYCGGKHSPEACFKRPQRQPTQPGESLSEDNCVFNGLQYFPPRAQLCILNIGVRDSSKLYVFSFLSDMFCSILINSGATN
ncbi:hypothetical protein O181_097097 [Austropuccinia psidii MF-1]|uniref:Uncharacterized protein n=1 Tax=Austropuccinia psidii MF-1 TaxID=1389203 RepID=A0A9Q3J7X3_9BASI|nr:hypothetical protein [Austropuccinia psidii MF-1]